jgi:predicted secreted acid phosphatase
MRNINSFIRADPKNYKTTGSQNAERFELLGKIWTRFESAKRAKAANGAVTYLTKKIFYLNLSSSKSN